MQKILPTKTAALLRILADQIEKGTANDFVLIVDTGEGYSHAFSASREPFNVIGCLEMVKRDVMDREIE